MDVDFGRENKSSVGVNGRRSRKDLVVRTTKRGLKIKKKKDFAVSLGRDEGSVIRQNEV